ncbi:hypothetical protein WJ18_05900 [Burkholderia vietnamiensis]|jgi:cyd operon protein YbgT|nr:hypothetical protein WJ18_05900 [Burkholderia vietnamiensis]
MIGLHAPLAHASASLRHTRGSPARPNLQGDEPMWYFSWILGIGVALGFGVINAMWLEAEVFSRGNKGSDASPADSGSRYS